MGLIVCAAMASTARGEVRLTVYNNDLALVKETRTLDYQRGVFDLEFTDVAAAIDPTSVAFTAVDHPNAVTLLEQDYRYDLVSVDKILQKYIDQQVQLITKQEKVHDGVLLAADPSAYTLRRPDGGLTLVNRAEVADLSLAELPKDLITRPTLVWKLQSDVDGSVRSEVRYLTKQIGWHAEYIATINAAEDGLELAGWVSIDNRSGATYADARIKLVAGDVNLVQDQYKPRPEMMAMSRAASDFQQEQFFEYHLYTLDRPSTVRDNEIKQLSLFEPATVAAKKVYTYEGARYGDNVRVTMEFVNSESAGLGMPLPKGKVRAMKASSDGSLEFVGEDLIDHTPKDEEVRVYLGNAFDIIGERTIVNQRRIADRVVEIDISVNLRNHKDADISVVVVEHFWGDWSISSESHKFEKKDANTAEWRLPVTANGETTLTFTVRQRS